MSKGRMTHLICLLPFLLGYSQMAHAEQWAKTYGGSGNDAAAAIQQTSDGGYIVAGHLGSAAWVLKLDSGFNASWQKTYGAGSEISSIQQTSDGGYIAAGRFNEMFVHDVWVLKLDSSGDVTWQKRYGTGQSSKAWSVQQTSDGGYIVAGANVPGYYGGFETVVLKLDSGGNVSWSNRYSIGSEQCSVTSGLDTYAASILQASDGGYIVAGTFSIAGMLLKLDGGGNVSWMRKYFNPLLWYADERFTSIQHTSDGGYIVLGYINGGVWVTKLNANFSRLSDKQYNGDHLHFARSIQQTSDGGYIVAGASDSDSVAWLLKLDSGLNVSWLKTYGGGLADAANSVQQTPDGGYIAAGSTRSYSADGNADAWLLRLNASGDINDCSADGTSSAVVSNAYSMLRPIPEYDYCSPVTYPFCDPDTPECEFRITQPLDTSPVTSSANATLSSATETDVCNYVPPDMDGDGYPSSADCDDNNAGIYPGAQEVCDGTLDNNCNGMVDEGCTCTNGAARSCGSDTGECLSGTETCVDGSWNGICSGETGPVAEVCDGRDNDCDGAVDEGLDADGDTIADCYDNCPSVANTVQTDSDGDGTGDVCELGYTPAGSAIVVNPLPGVTITFSEVTGAGVTSISTSSTGPFMPTQYKTGNPPTYYDIHTAAQYTPPVTVCIDFSGVSYGNENQLKLMHWDGAGWVNITNPGYPDTVNNIVCGTTNSLSPFVIAELAETDSDGDGYSVAQGDCNDSDPAIHPGVAEICNSTDDNCNGSVDEGVYVFAGFQPPFNSEGSNVFRTGSALPVKVVINDCSGLAVPTATVAIAVHKIADENVGIELELDAESPGAASSGGLFRYDAAAGQYVFNLSTKGYTAGTYKVYAKPDDGKSYSVSFSLKQ